MSKNMELVKTSATPRSPGNNGRMEIALKRAVRTSRRMFGPQHVNGALALIQLGDFLYNDQRFEESSSAYRQAASIYEDLGVGHELLWAIALRSLSQCLFTLDDFQAARAIGVQATDLIVTYQ
jgi:hypothetical protein